jgi:hypothetical protein
MNYDAKKADACARAAHEVNRAYCLALGDTWRRGGGARASSGHGRILPGAEST